MGIVLAAMLVGGSPSAEPTKYVVVNTTPFVVVNRVPKRACVCGDACVCKPGACPGSCPLASKPDLVTTDGRTIRWTGSAYVFVGSAPAVSGCANGQCPLPRR